MTRAKVAEQALVSLQRAVDCAKEAARIAAVADLPTIAEGIGTAVGDLAAELDALMITVRHLREREAGQ